MKGLRKKTELPRTLNRCVCPEKNERQQKKPVAHSIKNKKKKGRTKSFEYPSTKI